MLYKSSMIIEILQISNLNIIYSTTNIIFILFSNYIYKCSRWRATDDILMISPANTLKKSGDSNFLKHLLNLRILKGLSLDRFTNQTCSSWWARREGTYR